ncbi:translesion error-prone DNA polymerase V autoproteolytic subunit [Candidatus Parcubacteria bacterium]|nr:translesion error-prone DNA polymerase V autoproteolytic subunit [Candidatus Parcubacteria bacterium]
MRPIDYKQTPHKAIPLVSHYVKAGFASPADDYTERVIDINDLFQVDEATSFYVRAEGQSMKNSGIIPEDILCVRKDLEPIDGDIVIAAIDNDFTVKTFRKRGNQIFFEASNEDFENIIPVDGQEVQVWGVVTGLARILKRNRK